MLNSETLKKFFKDKENWILIAVLVFAFILRLYYFILTRNQVTFWDEAEYLVKAKHWAFGTSDLGWNPLRELLISLFWAFLYKLGVNELVIRFTEVIFSMLAVFLTYLVGKELFDKRIGLIAAFLVAVFNHHLFYSSRFLVDIPASVFWLSTIYFFWKGYIKKESKYGVYYAGLFAGLGFLMHYSLAFLLAIVFIFLLLIEKLEFFKDKRIWITLGVFVLLLLPYVVWSEVNYGKLLPRFAAASVAAQTGEKSSVGWYVYYTYFPMYLQEPLFIIFLIGLLLFLFNLSIGFDLIIQKKEKSLYSYLFVILWAVITILIYSYMAAHAGGHSEPRYMIAIFAPLAYIISFALIKGYELAKKYSKYLAISLLLVVLIISAYSQLTFTDAMIKDKINSEVGVREAGIWIKQNSNRNDAVLSNNLQMELTYYSERKVVGFEGDDKNMTTKIKDMVFNAKYVVLTGYYPSSQWTYEYPSNHTELLRPVQVYFADKEQKQPVVVIYQVTRSL